MAFPVFVSMAHAPLSPQFGALSIAQDERHTGNDFSSMSHLCPKGQSINTFSQVGSWICFLKSFDEKEKKHCTVKSYLLTYLITDLRGTQEYSTYKSAASVMLEGNPAVPRGLSIIF